MAPRLKQKKNQFCFWGNWVSHSVNKCWLSLSGLGCVCWNSKNSPCFGSNVFGLYGAGSCPAVWSQCGLKSLPVCLLHMWICSTDVSWLPGRQALLPLALLALVVTWWHTVASGVQTGLTQGKHDTEQHIALWRPPMNLKRMTMRGTNAGFFLYSTEPNIFRIFSVSWLLNSWYILTVPFKHWYNCEDWDY